MSGPKRPPDPANSTLIMGPEENRPPEEEDGTVEVEVDEQANDGATAFLRPAATRRPAAKAPGTGPETPGSTVAMRAPVPPAEDDVPGGTAFVRVDGPGGQRSRKEQAPLAPRKGLQVSLPDEEASPPPPKRVVAPPMPEKK